MVWALVGFIVLPVVCTVFSWAAWRGYCECEPVAILLSSSMLVPFCYFLWKSLTLRVGDTWPMFMWPIGFAAVAINIVVLAREGWPAWMVRATNGWARAAVVSGIAMVVLIALYYMAAPWNFIGKADPI